MCIVLVSKKKKKEKIEIFHIAVDFQQAVGTAADCCQDRGEHGECSLAAFAALLTRGEHCSVTLQLSF